MTTMNALHSVGRIPVLPVLRPEAALRRVEQLFLGKRRRKAFRLLSRLARRNVPAAQLRLARLYLEGIEVPESRQDAILWCEKAAQAELVDAQCMLATLYLSGSTSPSRYSLFGKGTAGSKSAPDESLAFQWAAKAASSGSADAKAILAHLHTHGPDMLRDQERSATFYRESAEQGSSRGALGYGMLLLQQPAGAAARGEAPKWIRQAADAGVPLANYVYAHMLQYGIELPVDHVAAAAFYKRSAQRGILQGQLRWGMLLIEGQHVGRNTLEGESWLRKAALAGETEASRVLGDLHSRNADLPPNFLEAAMWYRQAAERGCATAAFQLAQLLACDRPGLGQDLHEAILRYCSAADGDCQPAQAELVKLLHAGLPAGHLNSVRAWFERKAATGDQKAVFNLGLSLLSTSMTSADKETALSWLRQAADTMPEAQYVLGYVLATGQGVTEDLQAGRRWIERAADAKLRDAQVLLAEMMLNGRGGERDVETAFRIFEEAAKAGHPGAAFATGMMLRGGHGVATNQERALAWLKLAAKHGHVHAQKTLDCVPAGQ